MAEISEAGLGVGINYELQMRQELNVCHGRMPKADVAKINNLYFLLMVQSTKKTLKNILTCFRNISIKRPVSLRFRSSSESFLKKVRG